MPKIKHSPQTVLQAVSSLLSYHDKEDYEGGYIMVRQRDRLFDFFAGGSVDDPDYAGEWGGTQPLTQSYFEDLAAEDMTEGSALQIVNLSDAPKADLPANTSLNMRQVRAETLSQIPSC